MDRQEIVERNVAKLREELSAVICEARHHYGGRVVINGIVNNSSGELVQLYPSSPPNTRGQSEYVLTEIELTSQKRPKSLVGRITTTLKNIGRGSYRINHWEERVDNFEEKASTRETNEIIQASQDAYNARHGFRD